MKYFNYIFPLLILTTFSFSGRALNSYDEIYAKEFSLVDDEGIVYFKLDAENANALTKLLAMINSGEFDKIMNFLLKYETELITILESFQNKMEEDQNSLINELSVLNKKIDEISKNTKPAPPPKSDSNKVYDIAEAGSIVIGNPNAAVTIIEWIDYQ